MIGAALILMFISIVYPRVAEAFRMAKRTVATEQVATERAPKSELDQSGISDVEWQAQPITVVPNDYTE